MSDDGRIAHLSGAGISGGIDDLAFARLEGEDAVSACFRYEVTAFSGDPDLDPLKFVGKEMTVSAATDARAPDALRHFSGMVDRMVFEGLDDGSAHFRYRLVLRPFLWLLSKASDNRIFQDLSVPDIVATILGEQGAIDFRLDLRQSYQPRTYCVQYGESTLHFVQRLLEHEGIFYFFEFDEGRHTLVLSDDIGEAAAVPDLDMLRFEPNADDQLAGGGVITRWRRTASAVTGRHVQTDYDFERPGADLMSLSERAAGHPNDAMERYDYPGTYVVAAEGDRLTALRLDEDQRVAVDIACDTTASRPASGTRFTLTDHERAAENDDYVILGATYVLWDQQYSATDADEATTGFSARWRVVPADRPWRPARATPRPAMKGPQTAVVVGPAGEEIYTDKYSRVKVQFHWDRVGGMDENASCWMRVSATWAGSGWGFIQIPRIGQEVIVDFLEGDPDRPIITGRVYNAEQMPPYGLPGEATKSGWKSNSSKGGGGWNELMFEDKAGSELVYFQAEKDHDELVKNNETRHIGNDWSEEVVHDAKQWVGNNRDEQVDNCKTTHVKVDRTVNIDNNDTETVGVDRSLTVGANETISVGSNSTETIGVHHVQTVGATQTVTVVGARTDTVGALETRSVAAAQINTIGAARQMSVGLSQAHDVGVSDSWEIGSDQSVQIGAGQSVQIGKTRSLSIGEDSATTVGKKMSVTVGEDALVEAGKTLVLTAGDSITLTCGKASIQMKKDGTIVIAGKDVSIDASGKINATAASEMTLKGSKINQN